MSSNEALNAQRQLLADLRASGDPAAAAQAQALQDQYYNVQMGEVASDVYAAARADGQPPAG